MTRVHLVRHGEAAPASADGERPLTDTGRADVLRLARWCEQNAVRPAAIVHSGILRAEQTARILADVLDPPGGVRAVRGLAPDDDPSTWAEELKHEPASTMLVAHMPLLGELSALLLGTGAGTSFATAQIACFERDAAGFRLVATWSPRAD